MRYLIIVLLMLGCSRKAGDIIIEPVEPITKIEVRHRVQDFEGIFYLENTGLIELIANIENDISIMTVGQSIISENPKSKDFATHPTMHGNRLRITDGRLIWSVNVKYVTYNNIKEDNSNTVITGVRRTDYLLTYVNGKMTLSIKVWEGPINNVIGNIVVKRIVVEI